MKRLCSAVSVILMISAFLFGCGRQTAEADPQTLPFPGTAWGTTPEEVCAALGLEEGSYERQSATDPDVTPSLFLTDVYMDVFGTNACVGFTFRDYNGDGRFSLAEVYVVYPQEADMQAVLSEMEQVYGAPTYRIGNTRAEWSSATLCRDYMSDQDREFLSGQASGEEAMEMPLTTIQLMTYFPFQANYKTDRSANVVVFRSRCAYYGTEGGYTG